MEVFFIDDAIHWGQLGMADGILATTGEHMKNPLDELISEKPPTHVCAACVNKRSVSPDNFVEGCVMSSAIVLVDMMTHSNYKVFAI